MSVSTSAVFKYIMRRKFVNDTSFDLDGPFILVDFITLGMKVKNYTEYMHTFKVFY